MSGDAIALAGLCMGLLGTLLGFVWRAAVTSTSHDLRLNQLEKSQDGLQQAINKLTAAVTKLDKHLAVSDARQSQGQFADSEFPPKG